MNDFIRLHGFFRKKIEPVYYSVCCPECGYTEMLEQEKECGDSEEHRRVTALPKVCPVCGAGVTRKRIPVLIRY
ncbi:hypothetical protein C5Q97_04745 [Victivallales bacterium CCUG 44730]|nr:hypothetical protein C5Q97_04745 [Victivallales bacterium CCUG 44730]